MKTALCLHGYFDSKNQARTGGKDIAIAAFNYIKEKIIDNPALGEVDVFIHTWDVNNSKKIKELYAPKNIIVEEQKTFEEELDKFDEFPTSPGMYKGNTIERGLSIHYSRTESIGLKAIHEKENKMKYDCVIVGRFDMGQRGKEHPQKYYATNFNFDKDFDPESVYCAYWNQFNHGIPEHWLYGGSDIMNTVATLYDKLFEYYQKDSDYFKAVTTGWPDSNAIDEFSNEVEKSPEDKNKEPLKVFPPWGCIDNHKVYKWHFIQTHLYEKLKYVDISEDVPFIPHQHQHQLTGPIGFGQERI